MKKVLLEYLIRNKKIFIIILILFCFGITVGVFSINNSNELLKNELNDYIEGLIENIKKTEHIDRFELLRLSIKENTTIILIVWFLGCTIVGGVFIYLAIIYRGFCLGYTIYAIISVLGMKQGIIISVISILPQNIIFLPAFFMIAENRYKTI